MGGGTGIGFLDEGLNVISNMATGGTVGFGDRGFNVGKGIVSNNVINAAKEITGARAAEKANELARQQYEESAAQAIKDRENAVLQNQRNEISLSQNAGSKTANKNNTTNKNNTPIGDISDFLGL